MEDEARAGALRGNSRFELAPPRHFLLPAILLLLSERTGHGYSLVKELETLGFGSADRPSVYRALASLEGDGLVESASGPASSGHERRVYRLTDHGERMLRAWMGVIKEERDHLDAVLRRYRATGTADSLLAEVEGGWRAVLGSLHSSVSSSSPVSRPARGGVAAGRLTVIEEPPSWPKQQLGAVRLLEVVPERSAVLIEARSSVGPISFGAVGVKGWITTAFDGDGISADPAPLGRLEIAVDGLRSGNRLYDAELLRRIDARRFPTASIDLNQTVAMIGHDRYRLIGNLTFHGVSRVVEGTVSVLVRPDDRIVVTGEQVFDIRDFAVESPTVLMLRIFPDVKVHLQVEAHLRD